jgi:mRNA interferase MazF
MQKCQPYSFPGFLHFCRRHPMLLLCPVTSQVKGYPFEITIPPGVPIQGVILSDQIRSLDWRARRAERVASLPEETIAQIIERLKTLLGLE